MFAATLFGQTQSGPGSGAPAPPGSTYSTEADGLSAIFEVLAEQKQARRWESGFDRLPPEVDRLVIWQPSDLSDQDWRQLFTWVGAGHTLILSTEDDRLPGTVEPLKASAARPSAPDAVTAGVRTVSVGSGAFETLTGDRLVELERLDGAAVLAGWNQGRGRMYWSADAAWLSNGLIDKENNLELALRLLTPAAGKQTAFDEVHHGYEVADVWWRLLRGPLQLFLLQLAVALGVFYWAYGVRFGAPRPLPAGPPRAAAEYVYSMSNLYRRARARRVALQALYRSLTRELGRLLGGTGGMSHQAVARAASVRAGVPTEQIEALLDKTHPDRTTTPSDAELIRLAREVEAIQRGVRNAGYRDQRAAGSRPD